MTGIALKFKDFFSKGHERTLKAKKNIAYSFLLKGVSIIIGFVLVPMTINYVNPTNYGIWLTLGSIISWFYFFDIGLGNGLKNKLSESIAKGDLNTSRIYVSTTYALLSILTFCFLLIFLIVNRSINWQKIFNISHYHGTNLNTLALVVFIFFCLQFIIQIINTVLSACHATSKASMISVLGQVLCLIMMFALTTYTKGNLMYLVITFAGGPLLIQIIYSVWFYSTDYKEYSPSIKLIDFKYARQLLGMGGVFFFIQIGALVLFQTDNIIITQVLGPQYVTTFNVAYKLFSALIMIFNIIINPFWSAFTDAYTRKDFQWIRNTLSKMQKIWVLFCISSLIVLAVSPFVFKIWLHNTLFVPWSLSLSMTFYVMVYVWQTLHMYLLNGIGKIRLQLYLVIISAIINLPLGIFMGRKIGLAGVTLSNAALFVFMGIIFHIQTKKILTGTAKGIWNK